MKVLVSGKNVYLKTVKIGKNIGKINLDQTQTNKQKVQGFLHSEISNTELEFCCFVVTCHVTCYVTLLFDFDHSSQVHSKCF